MVFLTGEQEIEQACEEIRLGAQDMGKDAPYSCTSGACSTCVAKVSEGEVEMDVCFALDEKEVADGYILTCQSRAKSSNLKLKFEG